MLQRLAALDDDAHKSPSSSSTPSPKSPPRMLTRGFASAASRPGSAVSNVLVCLGARCPRVGPRSTTAGFRSRLRACCGAQCASDNNSRAGFFFGFIPHGGMMGGLGLFPARVEQRTAKFLDVECVVLWCNIALCYSLLFGYIKHDLNKCSCFEKNSAGLGPCAQKHASWLARGGDKPIQQLPKPHKREIHDVGQDDYACDEKRHC